MRRAWSSASAAPHDGVHHESATLQAARKRREEEAERRRAETERLERERARGKSLEEAAARWETALRIRAFLSALKDRANPEFGVDDEYFREWLEWAVRYADSLDPLRGEISELLMGPGGLASGASLSPEMALPPKW